MSYRRLAGCLALAALVASCGGISDPSKNTVDTFSGTLQLGGENRHNYTLGDRGEVEVTLTSVTPTPANGAVGIGIGQVNGASCPVLGTGYITQGIVNRTQNFGELPKGSYCVIVFDPAVLTVPATYSGRFSHP